MKNICIKNKEDNINLNNYKMSILITQDGFSYSFYSIPENRINTLVSKSFSIRENRINEIKDFLINEELINNEYSQVNIILATNKVTIIPNVLFNSREAEKIYYLNFEKKDNEKILFSLLPKSENVVIYSADIGLLDTINNLFENHNIVSHSVPFIEKNYTRNKISENREGAKMFIQVFDDFADILVFQNEKIQLYNTFIYKTNNDILYYIINVFEQLRLSQEDTIVSFSGFIETDNLAVINLRKFVKLVYFEEQNTEFKYYYKFQEISPHYFVNFLNINKCE